MDAAVLDADRAAPLQFLKRPGDDLPHGPQLGRQLFLCPMRTLSFGRELADQPCQPVRHLIERHFADHADHGTQHLPEIRQHLLGKQRIFCHERSQLLALNHPHPAGLESLHIDRIGTAIEGRHFGKCIPFLQNPDDVLPSLRRETVNLCTARFDDMQAIA